MEHVVKQGEHLARIAELYGFLPDTIWNDPANAELKKKRTNPNVLKEGDVITIPERKAKDVSGDTTKLHKFRMSTPTLKLRIVVEDWTFKPVKDSDYTLEIGGIIEKKKTSGEGLIERDIPASSELGTLWVADEDLPVKVGHLDPEDELSGQKARLNNLGYDAGPPDDPIEDLTDNSPAALRFRSAVEEFQCDQKMHVSGTCDPATQAKLVKVHGC
jgi:hypothetical protein